MIIIVHLGQTLRIETELLCSRPKQGLKTLYINDVSIQIFFKKVFTLSLMPIDFVPLLFENLRNLTEFSQKAKLKLPGFIDYVYTTYISSETFTIQTWNHFKTEDELTNNRVEGDNFQMNNCCGAAHPDISKAVKLLQGYESKAADKYRNGSREDARAAMCRIEDHDRNRDFAKLVNIIIIIAAHLNNIEAIF